MRTDDDQIFARAERLALAAVKDPSLIPDYHHATELAKAREGAPGWKSRGKKMTQCEIVLAHIDRAGSISQREAYLDHGISRLAARIHELRNGGVDLERDMRVNPATGQEYARYFRTGHRPS